MYIAGLRLPHGLPISHENGVESIVVFTTLACVFKIYSDTKHGSTKAKAEAGEITSMPKSPWGIRATIIHVMASFLPPAVYAGTVALNGFVQPEWMENFGFSENIGVGEKAGLRVVACVVTLTLWKVWDGIYKHLGSQLSPIGVREKPKLVETGPYRYVRHPMYSLVMAQELLFSVMSWSYIPLLAFGVTAIAYAVKMPVEEHTITEDPTIGPAYQEYKSRVTSRILPGIW
ncbi:hypothetical protein JAAARDRAFT_122345 [Jaapia argillacea MUCL 33604]|uniref:Protein-S-isoprenylcysteine O-methyltransferase n=1 Tax=Jaapia argillacea MUCL 33604 TaxID=933084 RepID=A0A067QFJ7_9AGAM|nr:hypothetical protein JAAARDRAFT_122345 [Jaapia argillacea MUCL 33604]